MKIYISAQAQSLNDARIRLSSHTEEIVEHICKLILMPNSVDRNHWCGEIAGQIHTSMILKNTKKLPTAKQIYAWTYGEMQDIVTDGSWTSGAVEDICDKYHIELQESLDSIVNKLDSVCITYFTWLSEQLAVTSRVASSKIYNKLDSLL